MQKKLKTRFAPSPTGFLHLGHGFSALLAFNKAKENDGDFYLRIEDIDQTRCRDEFREEIYKDLKWLGLNWQEPVRVQSEHFDQYAKYLNILSDMGVLYPCFCTRAEIKNEIANSPSAPHGFDGVVYPQTCKKLSHKEQQEKQQNATPYALRLNMANAISLLKAKNSWPLFWYDELKGEVKAQPEKMGDVVLARKETPTSYHLAVCVDDNLTGITHVVRGLDLFEATHIHTLLQALFDFNKPIYHHHTLLVDDTGNRLAKRNFAATLKSLRENDKNGYEVAKKLLDRA